MKIIITEDQHKFLLESSELDLAKKLCFRIWQEEVDKGNTPELDFSILQYMNITTYYERQELFSWFTEFLGGWEKMKKVAIQLLHKTYDTINYDFSGGYDFRFTVIDKLKEDKVLNEINCGFKIKRDGEVTLIMTDGETYLLRDLEDRDFWWEIDDEIRNIIDDILFQEITKKTGIRIDVKLAYVEA